MRHLSSLVCCLSSLGTVSRHRLSYAVCCTPSVVSCALSLISRHCPSCAIPRALVCCPLHLSSCTSSLVRHLLSLTCRFLSLVHRLSCDVSHALSLVLCRLSNAASRLSYAVCCALSLCAA